MPNLTANASAPLENEASLLEGAKEEGGAFRADIFVGGMKCARCMRNVESLCRMQEGVLSADVALSTGRLKLVWKGRREGCLPALTALRDAGFTLTNGGLVLQAAAAEEKRYKQLLKYTAVAAFGAANIMTLSVAEWAGNAQGMDPASRLLMHRASFCLSLPVLLYSGRPFFEGAMRAIRGRAVNMDLPIFTGVTGAFAISAYQMYTGQDDIFFDSALMLTFVLLAGRTIDAGMRKTARSGAAQLLEAGARDALKLLPDGTREKIPASHLRPEDLAEVLPGDKFPADGVIESGESSADSSTFTGESLPRPLYLGEYVRAGECNLERSVIIRVVKSGEDTALAETARALEAAEHKKTAAVIFADKVVKFYTPAVHVMAFVTLIGRGCFSGHGWHEAFVSAVAALLVTCPCGLALATPAVYAAATGALIRRGVLTLTPAALERFPQAEIYVFDKTGTLTLAELIVDPTVINSLSPETRAEAAALAAASSHPLAKALAKSLGAAPPAQHAELFPGKGVRAGEAWLGSAAFCGAEEREESGAELVFRSSSGELLRFAFSERLREDAVKTIAALKKEGVRVLLFSGDKELSVQAAAEAAGIEEWRARMSPTEKAEAIRQLKAEGHCVCMVGDGVNDSAALVEADCSMAPDSGSDLARSKADAVFRGGSLYSVMLARMAGKKAFKLIKQNITLSALYNTLALPLAMAGMVNPMMAALLMSASSLTVTLNATRALRLPADVKKS